MMNTVILCNGHPPHPEQIVPLLADCDLFIAADGGADTAFRMNLSPHVIIGDLDSYVPSGDESATVIRDHDQETNDLEKALTYAVQRGATQATVFGATGQRLDHTLKNLSVLKQFHDAFDHIVFKDRHSDIFLLKSPFRTTLPVGISVSLFPLSGTVEGITTKGLRWPLQDETLQNGVRDGSSNETSEHEVEIEFKKGDLLFFINHNPG